MPSHPFSREDHGRAAFHARGLHAKRSFGQCFLADPNIARNIALEATSPQGGTCLEIGPGTGALTRYLLARAARVVAVERDRDLVPLLRETYAEEVEADRLRVVEADAAARSWLDLLADGPRPHCIVGNVPYQITGRLLQRAIDTAPAVDRVVFMVQKEVADRIGAPVGAKEYGALSVFVQHAFVLLRRMFVPSSCFRPRPQVDSTVVVLQPRGWDGPAASTFEWLVTAAFSRRRKTLRNAVKGWRGVDGDTWEKIARQAGISLDDRAERVAPDQWRILAQLVEEAVSEKAGAGG